MKAKLYPLIITIILASLLAGYFVFDRPVAVDASGYDTMTLYCDDGLGYYARYYDFETCCHLDTATQTTGSLLMMYGCGASSGKWDVQSGLFAFGTGGAPGLEQIIGIEVRLYCNNKNVQGAPVYQSPYFSLFDTDAGINEIIGGEDIDNFNDEQIVNRVSYIKNWNQLTEDDWITFTIIESDWETVLDGDVAYFALASEYHAQAVAPGAWVANTGYWSAFDCDDNNRAEMVITYGSEAETPEFTYHTNDAVDTVLDGTEVADNITLSTISCMYAGDDLEFDVSGDSGASISLRLVDSAGTVKDSHADSVRVDGHYYWRIDSLATTYAGFVKAVEDTHNLSSPWVRVEPVPDSSQANLKIYSASTTYPQYEFPFLTYVVARGQYMVVHWKTNIDGTSECDDHILEMYVNGDNITPAYSANFTYLGENYFQGTQENWQASIHWRFALFTPKALSGTNLYGGLVNNLGLDFVPDNKGFIQPVIYKVTDGAELTDTHSAYWYVTSASDGIQVNLIDTNITTDQEIGVKVTVGKECRADDYLDLIKVQVVGYREVYSTIKNGDNYFYLDSLENEGSYDVRITMYKDSLHTYEYIYQIPLEVSETGITEPEDGAGIGGWLEMIQDWIGIRGWDSTGAQYIIIFGAMIFVFAVFYKVSVVFAIGMALFVLGIGIAIGWIDKWLIIVLALGAGITLYSIFKKKTSGGYREE